MGSDFTLGAYGASAVAVLLGVSYVLRLLQDDSVDESEIRELYSIDGELLPSPVRHTSRMSGVNVIRRGEGGGALCRSLYGKTEP
jgi:hypothetical protein